MISRHKLSRHFLPHFLVDFETASRLAEPHKVHHKAHALNLTSLFIYLQILLIAGGGLFIIKLKAPQILGIASISSDQIISLTNAKRAENGAGALTYNYQLAAAAAAKASDMFANDYWAHNSPGGKTPWSFITAAGYRYVYAGENLARDFADPGSVVDAWMNSPSHRSNLIDKNFKEIGVAVSNGKLGGREGTLVVQMFGAGISQIPATQPALQVQVSPATPVASAQASAAPSAEPTATPAVSPAAVAVAQPAAVDFSTTTVLSSRQFSVAKIVSLMIIGFIFMLFALEIFVSLKRADMHVRSGIIAHLALLAFVLLAVWYAISGAIL